MLISIKMATSSYTHWHHIVITLVVRENTLLNSRNSLVYCVWSSEEDLLKKHYRNCIHRQGQKKDYIFFRFFFPLQHHRKASALLVSRLASVLFSMTTMRWLNRSTSGKIKRRSCGKKLIRCVCGKFYWLST